MKKLLLTFGLVATIASCSSPLDKKFNEETAAEDIEALKSELDTIELEILAGTMIRLKLQDKKLEEMTYKEILKDGKKWKSEQEEIEAEQNALAEKAAKEEADRIKRLSEAVMVSCFDKGFKKFDYEEFITYKFVIKNKSHKEIRAIKGAITFTNLFDEKIKSLSFVYDQPIEAGEEIFWNASTDYNQFMDDDQALKNKSLKDLKVVWEPEKIIFVDGTTLE